MTHISSVHQDVQQNVYLDNNPRKSRNFQELCDWEDITYRTMRNKDVSPVYRFIYLAIIDLYPEVLSGQRVAIQVHKIREAAGWVSKSSATKFFQDMRSIEALEYDPGKYCENENERIGYLTANLDLFPYIEKINTKDAEKRRKAREEAEKQRKQFKHELQINQCEECSSSRIIYTAIATCESCGHEHDPIENIPASMIHIEAEVVEIADEQPAEEEIDVFLDFPEPKKKKNQPVQIKLAETTCSEDVPTRACPVCKTFCWVISPEFLWTSGCIFNEKGSQAMTNQVAEATTSVETEPEEVRASNGVRLLISDGIYVVEHFEGIKRRESVFYSWDQAKNNYERKVEEAKHHG